MAGGDALILQMKESADPENLNFTARRHYKQFKRHIEQLAGVMRQERKIRMLFRKKSPEIETSARQPREFFINDEEQVIKICNLVDERHSIGGWAAIYRLWKYIGTILPETEGDFRNWEIQLCGGRGIKIIEKVEE